ncbi:hypothetical protein ACQCSX_16075 [Pseudarthrobacter sp. P1]|uniref:hypothetical protein n=1 Tax=Pseudarthrobacter sp. P1 TaxID=3418418 RepID=UPI003CF8E086
MAKETGTATATASHGSLAKDTATAPPADAATGGADANAKLDATGGVGMMPLLIFGSALVLLVAAALVIVAGRRRAARH